MYAMLRGFSQRPAPFSRYTAKTLWTRPHLAEQMLAYHLDQSTDLASRRIEQIDAIVAWFDQRLGLADTRLCDLGCGPGLYAERFAARGAAVVGIDFSAHALDYARSHGSGAAEYLQADYLEDPLPEGFHTVTLIYTDLCALSPAQRHHLLSRIHTMLLRGGRLVLDVVSSAVWQQREETTQVEERLMGGFWAPGDYVGLQRTLLYPEQMLALDRYLIVEPEESWQVENWTQYFTPAMLEAELNGAGFRVDGLYADLIGTALEGESAMLGAVAIKG